jgi:hypothetical protein
MSHQSSPAFDTPNLRRTWAFLAADRANADVASALERTSLSGNGGVDQPAGITYGESVVVVSDVSPVVLCGVNVGQAKIFFNTECLVQSHVDNGGQFSTNIANGIYVIAGRRDRALVYKNPIGDFSLMDDHGDVILSTIDSIPANWTPRFYSLRQATTSDEAVEREALRANAKRMQTPGKRASRSSLSSFRDANTFSALLDGEQWEEDLKGYEDVWKELAFDKDLTLPGSFKVSELMPATARHTAEIEEAVKEVIEEGQDEKSWVTRELNGVALRTIDLEKILGDLIGESASVWTAVSALTTEVSDKSIESAERFSCVNVEFEEMFGAVTGFQVRFQEKFQTLERRVDKVEFGGDSVEADSLEVSSLKLRLDDISKQGLADRCASTLSNPGWHLTRLVW